MNKQAKSKETQKQGILNTKDAALQILIKEVQAREPILGDKSLRIIELCYNIMKNRQPMVTQEPTLSERINPDGIIAAILDRGTRNMSGFRDNQECYAKTEIYSYLERVVYTGISIKEASFININQYELLATVGYNDNIDFSFLTKMYYVMKSRKTKEICIITPELNNRLIREDKNYILGLKAQINFVISSRGKNGLWLVTNNLKEAQEQFQKMGVTERRQLESKGYTKIRWGI